LFRSPFDSGAGLYPAKRAEKSASTVSELFEDGYPLWLTANQTPPAAIATAATPPLMRIVRLILLN
jgi:hypothetical protein